jgi:hypothetical protein
MTEQEMIVNAVAVLLGDYEANRKRAALLILQACLPDKIFKNLINDEQLKSIIKALK